MRLGFVNYLFSISWYEEFDFLISRFLFPDIKKSFIIPIPIFWYQEMAIILDIENSIFLIFLKIAIRIPIFWYQEMAIILDIENSIFFISRNIILDIKKWNLDLDIKKSNSWYQEIKFLISSISWYQEFDIFISRIWFLDFKKSNSWYIELEFLISRIPWPVLEIKKYLLFLYIRKWNSWYLQISRFLDIKNSIVLYQKMNLISWYQEILNK